MTDRCGRGYLCDEMVEDATWVLDRGSTLPVDDVTVLSARGGSGRWIRSDHYRGDAMLPLMPSRTRAFFIPDAAPRSRMRAGLRFGGGGTRSP